MFVPSAYPSVCLPFCLPGVQHLHFIYAALHGRGRGRWPAVPTGTHHLPSTHAPTHPATQPPGKLKCQSQRGTGGGSNSGRCRARLCFVHSPARALHHCPPPVRLPICLPVTTRRLRFHGMGRGHTMIRLDPPFATCQRAHNDPPARTGTLTRPFTSLPGCSRQPFLRLPPCTCVSLPRALC